MYESLPAGADALLRGERDGTLTRRELFLRLSALGLAPHLLRGDLGLASQVPAPPSNVRVLYGNKRVVSPSDLRFLGFMRYPTSAGLLYYSRPSTAFRRVSGQLRFFTYGDWPPPSNSPVQEFAIPDTAPSRTLASAPFLSLVKDWGDVRSGHIRTTTNDGSEPTFGNLPGGLHWDEARNTLWWTYGSSYVPTESHPTVGATVLDDKAGTYQTFGPWRTEWNAQLTLGAMGQIPPAFAAAYTNGKSVGMMANQSAGNAGSPHGAVLCAATLPDPRTTPVDAIGSTHFTVANHGLILHDLSHRQVRDDRYKLCDYVQKYVCSGGITLEAGQKIWSSQNVGMGTNDTMCSFAWIDLPDKHGLLYFGQLATTPTGYTAPYDADGLIHRGYASLGVGPNGLAVCCHGQEDAFFQSTGPWAHCIVPMGWIYNPDDLVATATKKADLWTRTPTSTFQWRDLIPELDRNYGWTFGSGAYFDPSSRRVYVTLSRHDRVTFPPHPRPVLMVFEVP